MILEEDNRMSLYVFDLGGFTLANEYFRQKWINTIKLHERVSYRTSSEYIWHKLDET